MIFKANLQFDARKHIESDSADWKGSAPVQMTWEEAVLWLKRQPDRQDLVRACFYDDPLVEAARRFHASREWQGVRALLPSPREGAKALDLGAGRGIAAYALATDGWDATALEPDPSRIVGAGAIRQLAADAGVRIAVVQEWGERLPFPDASFDVVHARQVLHHANDLDRLCAEVFRVLKPGGFLVATREHVISRKEDLDAFLASHPLHSLYGGENAYTLARYRSALEGAGFQIRRMYAPWESEINLFPQTILDARINLARRLRWPLPRLIPLWVVQRWSRWLDTPGRLYSFVVAKP